jgi:hypothetical protein
MPQVGGLLSDLEGQVLEAISTPAYWLRWGRHYLPSLQRAHALQQCTNFKDPGLQPYGTGRVFRAIQDAADHSFLALPPPTHEPDPELAALARQFGAAAAAPLQHAQPVNMHRYHHSGNPCFAGDGIVAMADGTTKLVAQLRRGDMVHTSAAGTCAATVRCVVRTPCAHHTTDLCEVWCGGTGASSSAPPPLRVTPWHPVDLGCGWQFPAELPSGCMRRDHSARCPEVFSFVLSDGPSIMISGIRCITLAHGVTADAVASHPFWGGQAVLNSLAQMAGWTRGAVCLRTGGCVTRDPQTGLVNGLLESDD